LRSVKSKTDKNCRIYQNFPWDGHEQRWIGAYNEGGLDALLVDETHRRGNHGERITPEALGALEEAMERRKIASYEQARKFLADQGVHFRNQSNIFRLFKRHRIKAKTGRPRHQKADPQEQEAFKKRRQRTRRANTSENKAVRVHSFDEARFGLINWHRRRYCPKGVRPPWSVERKYRWS